MLNKSRFAIAAALILGAVSAAQAANENFDRELGSACGPLHQRMGGRAVNPVYNRTICYGRGIYAYAPSHRLHRRWWFY
jgi:hypothetical protein